MIVARPTPSICQLATRRAAIVAGAPASHPHATRPPIAALKSTSTTGVALKINSNSRQTTFERRSRESNGLCASCSHFAFSPSTQPQISGDAIRFDTFEEARGQTLYWKLPTKFVGDKVTSYGGNLKFVYRCSGGDGNEQSQHPDVILRVSVSHGRCRNCDIATEGLTYRQ